MRKPTNLGVMDALSFGMMEKRTRSTSSGKVGNAVFDVDGSLSGELLEEPDEGEVEGEGGAKGDAGLGEGVEEGDEEGVAVLGGGGGREGVAVGGGEGGAEHGDAAEE